MAIRFRKYEAKNPKHVVTAIRLTENNAAEVVAYINKNKGVALDESKVIYGEQYGGGSYTAVKVSLVQKNFDSYNKVKKGVRKAFRGDLIVRDEVELPNGKKGYEFRRVRDAGINNYVAV